MFVLYPVTDYVHSILMLRSTQFGFSPENVEGVNILLLAMSDFVRAYDDEFKEFLEENYEKYKSDIVKKGMIPPRVLSLSPYVMSIEEFERISASSDELEGREPGVVYIDEIMSVPLDEVVNAELFKPIRTIIVKSNRGMIGKRLSVRADFVEYLNSVCNILKIDFGIDVSKSTVLKIIVRLVENSPPEKLVYTPFSKSSSRTTVYLDIKSINILDEKINEFFEKFSYRPKYVHLLYAVMQNYDINFVVKYVAYVVLKSMTRF